MFPQLAKICCIVPQFAFRVVDCFECKKSCDSVCGMDGGAGVSIGSGKVATFSEIRRFILDCMKKVGTPDRNAQVFAEALLDADMRGHSSHGLNRLNMYINDIRKKAMDPAAVPKINKETESSAAVDGQNGIGAVVAHWCMELAIQKAEKTGIGIVSVKGSNHFGVGQSYVMQAVHKGMIGLAFTNASPVMVPTRAKQAALGTNPISFGAPAHSSDNVLVDVATTLVSIGKIDIYRRKGEKLLEGWAMNPEGQSETDPEAALQYKLLYPLGGTEENAGYKGYALGLLVEMMAGILAGSNYGPNVRVWSDKDDAAIPANLGQCFIAINPKFFEPGFEERLQDLINYIRKMEPADPQKPVLLPGDLERSYMKSVEHRGGVVYDEIQLEKLNKIAQELSVNPIRVK